MDVLGYIPHRYCVGYTVSVHTHCGYTVCVLWVHRMCSVQDNFFKTESPSKVCVCGV